MTDIYNNNKLISIKNDMDFSNIEVKPIDYDTLYITDINSSLSKEIKLSHPTNIFSSQNTGNTLYLASYDYKNEIIKIKFSKFLLNTEEEIPIYSLDFLDSRSFSNPLQTLTFSFPIYYGISDRYALFGHPDIIPKYGKPSFDKLFLIDSEEKNSIL